MSESDIVFYIWIFMFGRSRRVHVVDRETLHSFKIKVQTCWGIPPAHQALTSMHGRFLTARWLRFLCENSANRRAIQHKPRVNLRIKGVDNLELSGIRHEQPDCPSVDHRPGKGVPQLLQG
jgi:hypothetical protein